MQRSPSHHAFTLIEMITVIAIIAILSGLVLSIAGLVQNKGVRAKTEAEIKMLSTALESYKTDFGGYPQDAVTDQLDARKDGSPSGYHGASLVLYKALSGDANGNGKIDTSDSKTTETANNYVPDFFRQARFNPEYKTSGVIKYLSDPFGFSYGYSTAGLAGEQEYRVKLQTDPDAARPAARGYNPTFDLWSTGGTTSGSDRDRAKWVKNW